MLGEYRGFKITVNYDVITHQFKLKMINSLTHYVDLSTDSIGNITRINNCLESMNKNLNNRKEHLDELYTQLDNAKEEVKKPFMQKQELNIKSVRLNELNFLLNLDKSSSNEIDKKNAII